MDEDYIQVAVSEVTPTDASMCVATGIDIATGETVVFGGDYRPMADIAWAIAQGEEPVADVPLWAVLTRA